MAFSIDLLTPSDIYARAINFTEFEIDVISKNTSTNLSSFNSGDKVYISPPIKYYLIDKNNNAYRNIIPPTNINPISPPINSIINVPISSSYNVVENLNGKLLQVIDSDGWKISQTLPIKPTIDPNANNSNNSFLNNKIIYFVLFLILFLIIGIIIYSRNSNQNNINYQYPQYQQYSPQYV